MKWEMVQLVSVCRPRQWKTLSMDKLSKEGYSVYGANGKIGFYNEYTHEYPTLAITCRGATCGSLHITEPKSYINGNAMAIDSLSDNVNINFLYYFFSQRGFADIISGSAQPQITGEGLNKIQIPLPPLSVQKEIAEILDTADALRKKDNVLLKKYDELAQSIFIEMFGDPVRNEKGWEVKKLGDVIHTFKYGTNEKSNSNNNGIPVLRIPNIIGNNIDLTDLKYSDLADKEVIQTKLEKGDLLFVRTNGNPNYIGRSALFNLENTFSFASYLIRGRLKEINIPLSNFIQFTLSFKTYRPLILKKATTTAGNYNINTESLKSLEIPVPNQDTLIKFFDIMQTNNLMKQKELTTITHTNNLFHSLLQKAFKGELT